MRLSTIKLAGFKSFVEPTKIPFPDKMTCVVGPNGCGKSNVIDAVRWVLGESSAKNLRGDAMTDVIFNGSTNRKPVSQASVELLFDNTQGYLAGSLVDRNQVAIKRLVTRDGQSFYYLNGTKCRKRDITDIFLGTGLGPRSYAIIEQGMISRLIESKPQELRVFIEEAAGVSKYKERRRETETRLRSTKENLERLLDLRQELQTQLDKLTVQAEQAAQYRDLKQQERQYKSELAVLRWQQLNDKSQQTESTLTELEQKITFFKQAHSGHDDVLLALKTALGEIEAQFQTAQQQVFLLANQHTKFEQQKISLQLQHADITAQLSTSQSQQSKNTVTQQSLAQQYQAAQTQLDDAEKAIDIQREQVELLDAALDELSEHEDGLFTRWQDAQRQNHQVEKQLQTSQHQVQAAQLKLQQLQQQQQDKQQQLSALQQQDLRAELDVLKAHVQQCKTQLANDKAIQEQVENGLHEAQRMLDVALQQVRTQQKELTTLNAHLEALGDVVQVEQQSHSHTNVLHQLEVQPGFECVIEQALTQFSHALVRENQSGEGSAIWPSDYTAPDNALSQFIISGVYPQWLDRILYLDNSDQSIDWEQQQWIGAMASSGLFIGPNWHIEPNEQAHTDSILLKLRKISEFKIQQHAVEQRLNDSERKLTEQQRQVTEFNQQLADIKQTIHTAAQQDAALQSKIEVKTASQQHWQHQYDQLVTSIAEFSDTEQTLNLDLEAALDAQTELEMNVDDIVLRAQSAEQAYQSHKLNINHQQSTLNQAKAQLHKQSLNIESLKSAYQLIVQQQATAQQSEQQLAAQCAQLIMRLDEMALPLEDVAQSMQETLEQEVIAQTHQVEMEQKLAQKKEELQQKEQGLQASQQQLLALEAQRQDLALALQASQLKASAALEPLSELNVQLKDVVEQLSADANPTRWQARLNQVSDKIRLLGAINLAAIDEFEQAKARKTYLDEQYQDLVDALDTLEGAIGKIDRETKSLFRQTFDQINHDLADLFPKVFGGGQAYLELTSDDMLESGVTIMARPPGKKNSTIHLLSGGEKALTALSLVFSIFRLNPAPFCMLDEVDAPLDDANVGRFCRLVEEMSQTVQFIYISHNKVAMEMAGRLTGVTMAEPGVSRMVSVDIEQAVEMAKAI
ncbi:chromosome segregation protein [Pseudoalteromonas ulvae UL12]|uniref:AAA family ATPase n=1 Tax=Pseudoalteromonas ulvae TaxID=107327 RepID=UPI00186B5F9F|nr:AAA family ATPase [Pseudoalteromonas ulvae]MBE0362469.1 chromosome segregation protein [Pseudoalteromonas ulvae UL12]